MSGADRADPFADSGADPTAADFDALLLACRPGLAEQRDLDVVAWRAAIPRDVPSPAFFAIGKRKRWQQACDAALAAPLRRTIVDVVIVPVWACFNEDELPAADWRRTLLIVDRDGVCDELETEHPLADRDVVVFARVERVDRAHLVLARDYAPDIPMLLRNDDYGAVAGVATERVVGVDRVLRAPRLEQPARTVKPWCTDAASAVCLDGLEPDVRARIERTINDDMIFDVDSLDDDDADDADADDERA